MRPCAISVIIRDNRHKQHARAQTCPPEGGPEAAPQALPPGAERKAHEIPGKRGSKTAKIVTGPQLYFRDACAAQRSRASDGIPALAVRSCTDAAERTFFQVNRRL